MQAIVHVDLDSLFQDHFAVVSTDNGSWVAYVPGKLPCICDTASEAFAVIKEGLPKKRRKGG